jgi:hypothetical protein
MSDLHQQIAELEAKIEELSDAAERCWKIGMAAKGMLGAGAVLFLILATGLFRLGPVTFVIALAAVLTGIALFGSNKRMRDEIMASIRAHEERRAEIIDALGLQAVDKG